jgi:autotransporter strand-loop-strand O-heptosyltransferase
MIYDNIKINKNNIKQLPSVDGDTFNIHFVNGPYVEVVGNSDNEYLVKFVNQKNGQTLYENKLKAGHWAKSNYEYFIDWKIDIYHGDDLVHTHKINLKNKKVFIAFDSKALGDTLAWFPYIETFRKKHNCELIVSTFHNYLFEEHYPTLKFVNPGSTVHNLYAMYKLGIYYTDNNNPNPLLNPNNFLEQPLQKMGSDILGLDYVEIKPKISNKKIKKDDKLITIAFHGTAQPKYWNNPTGWQDVVDWLNDKGYKVKLLSREESGYMGNYHPDGIKKHPEGSLQSVMNQMEKSKAFIGIGSGLSWLSWALGTKTVLISGFSEKWAEMQDCIRIGAPKDKCGGCFNKHRLDAGDWNWCPEHKGTERHFECTKSITSNMVITELKKFL